MSQSDELATKIYAASADLEWPDFVAYVNKVFDAEHGRLLVSLRGKMPEKPPQVEGNKLPYINRGYIEGDANGARNAIDDALAAIDAELDRLKGTSA